MKTSHILLAIIAFVALTGMVATDVLLKQQYEKIDWRNPYQQFEQRSLPIAKHWIVEGTPTTEIIVLKSADKPQALIDPEQVKFYRTRQEGDTVFVSFTTDYSGYQLDPSNDADRELAVRLVLRLPNFQALWFKNGRFTLDQFDTDKLTVTLENSRLRTNKLKISELFNLTASHNSFAMLGTDRYTSLRTTIQDSSGVQLNNTQTDSFVTEVSPKTEVRLSGQALKWLK